MNNNDSMQGLWVQIVLLSFALWGVCVIFRLDKIINILGGYHE